MVDNTPEEFARKLKALKGNILLESKNIQRAAFDGVIGQYKSRIFDEGLASDGAPIDSKVKAKPPREGAYSRGHGKRRKRANRKTDKINLMFFGNLFNSLEVGVNGDDIVMGFNNNKQAEIAGYHEDYREKEIFPFTNEEVDVSVEAGLEEVNVILDKTFNQ